MAGIDNTLIFALLQELQADSEGHRPKDRDLYQRLYLIFPEYRSSDPGYKRLEKASRKFKLGDFSRKPPTVFWPPDDTWYNRIAEADIEHGTAMTSQLTATRGEQRFPPKGNQDRLSFSSQAYNVLLEAISRRKDGPACVRNLCAAWRVPAEQQAQVAHLADSPRELAAYLIQTAVQENGLTPKKETQLSLKDKLPAEEETKPVPVAPPRSAPAPVPPRPAPVHKSGRVSHLLAEGSVFDGPHPDPRLPARKDHGGDPLAHAYQSLFLEGTEVLLPYKEIFGSGKPGQQEYVEGKNLTIRYVPETADIKHHVPSLNYKEIYREEIEKAAKLGYTRHPPKLWLMGGKEWKDRDALTLTFGKIGYLDHRLYRRELDTGGEEFLAFEAAATSPRGWVPPLDHALWAACGGGCWVVTADGYLVLSCRNAAQVAEVPGRLSYSASGSYDRYRDKKPTHGDNTPGRAMAAELREELGLPQPEPEELVLVGVGIDLERYLSQLSYLWRCPYTAAQVRQYRREDEAVDANEQKILFVPFRPEACAPLLLHYEFEPGAAASLRRLLEKSFGPLRP